MIVYALIARGRTVLAEFTSRHGNFSTVTRALLSKIPAADGRMSYVCDDHVFHYAVHDGITYLCMADSEGKRRIAFAFLEDVRRRFEANYGGSKHAAAPFVEVRRALEHQPMQYRAVEAAAADPRLAAHRRSHRRPNGRYRWTRRTSLWSLKH